MKHLKNIAERETDVELRAKIIMRLARVFAPLVIGYSHPLKQDDEDEFRQMFHTMFGLIQINSDLCFVDYDRKC